MRVRTVLAASTIVAVIGLTGSAPAGAGTAPPGPDGGSALRDASALVRSLHSATTAGRLREVAAAAGIQVPPVPAGDLVSADPGLLLLPASLRGPVGSLVAAVERSSALVREAFGGRGPDEIAALARSILPAPPARSSFTGTGPFPAPVPVADPAPPSVPADVDLGRIVAAAVLLSDAVDRATPALAAAGRRLAGAQVAVDRCPSFKVDVSGNTTHGPGCQLIVDLSGDDTYEAGGPGAPAYPVTAIVDVAGNDRYLQDASADVLKGHGAGVGGVDAVFDALGDDVYTARNTRLVPDLTPARPAQILAQGAALLGVGIVADGGGRDAFTALASTRGGAASTIAQGAATAGVGLLTHGRGAASYRADAVTDLLMVERTPTLTRFSVAGTSTVAQGGGLAGGGVLLDAGGVDVYSATATGGSSSLAVGQGGSVVGAGILADGGGADSYTLSADDTVTLDLTSHATCPAQTVCGRGVRTTVEFGSSRATGQGGASTIGTGVLADGGDEADTLTAVSRTDATAIAKVDFAGGGGRAGAFTAMAEVVGGEAEAQVHGSGEVGAGVLIGGAGNDVYEAVVDASTRAIASAIGGSTNDASAFSSGGGVTFLGQGYAATGAGILTDAGGADAYRAVLSSTSTADAVCSPAPCASSETVRPGSVFARGRGYATAAGAGVLLDGGGTDVYSPLPGVTDAGGNDRCWTNSAPGLPDTNVGIGADVGGGLAGCIPPPNV